MHKIIISCLTTILLSIFCGCAEQPIQPLSDNDSSDSEMFASKPAIGLEIIFDQGPDTGKIGKYYTNLTKKQNYADIFSFDKNTEIDGIIVYTKGFSKSVHVKILSDIKGLPSEYLYEEDISPDSWILDPTGNKVPQYQLTVNLSTPFYASANTSYWIGVSSNDKDICQYTIHSPGDGEMALFEKSKFTGRFCRGDMMFQLVSINYHGNSVLVADAGDDQTIYTTDKILQFTLDGSDSRGHNLTYEWSQKGRVFSTEVTPEISFKKYEYVDYIYDLTVTDNKGNTDTDTVIVKVRKASSQKLTINVITPQIWPPNHKMVLAAEVSPIKIVKSVKVKSNEPQDGTGDGDTAPDWEIIFNKKAGTVDVYLRAERSGNSDGRIYTIYASDGKNSEKVTVTVPKSMEGGKK